MDGVKISLTLIISISLAYGTSLTFLNNPVNSPKSDEFSDSKVAPRSISKNRFSNLPKLPHPIDEEENFWINPRREKKRYYESVKIGSSTKKPEDVYNFIDIINKNEPSVMNSQINYHLESHPTWFGFPESFTKIGPRPAKATERAFNTKRFESESKTVLKSPLPYAKSGSNVDSQQGTTADESSNSGKDTNTEKSSNAEKTSDKSDLDVNDLLILKESSDKLDDSNEENIKEEREKQPTDPPQAIHNRGFFNPPKRRKAVPPIFSTSIHILRLPYQRNGFSFHNQVQSKNSDINRFKYLDIEGNEIKNNSKEHLILTEKVPFLVFNTLKKHPLQNFYHLHPNVFKSERSVNLRNFRPLCNLPQAAFTETKIAASPVQGHVEDLESLKLHGQNNEPKMMKLNFRSVKSPAKKESFKSNRETSA